jgi:hypothetical protein
MSTATITVESIDTKEGVSDKTGKPWTKYALKAGDDYYSTFQRQVIEPALGGEGKTFEIDYEVDGKFKNLKAVRPHAGGGSSELTSDFRATNNGTTDWDKKTLWINRIALWKSYLEGDTPRAVIAAKNFGENPTPQQIADAVYRGGKELVKLAESDIYHRAPSQQDEDIPF